MYIAILENNLHEKLKISSYYHFTQNFFLDRWFCASTIDVLLQKGFMYIVIDLLSKVKHLLASPSFQLLLCSIF